MKKGLLTLLLAGTLFYKSLGESSREYSDLKKYSEIEILNFEKNYENKPLSEKEIKELLSEVYIPDKYFSKRHLERMILKESSRNPLAVNEKTLTKGLIQIKRIAWEEVEYELPYELNWHKPKKNIRTGQKYLFWLEKTISKNNPKWKFLTLQEKRGQIIAGFDWGYGNLKKNNWDPEKFPKETKRYVELVTKNPGGKTI